MEGVPLVLCSPPRVFSYSDGRGAHVRLCMYEKEWFGAGLRPNRCKSGEIFVHLLV